MNLDRVGPRLARSGRLLSWLVVALWMVAAVLLAPLAGRVGDVRSSDVSLAVPDAAEATRALVRERKAFPDADTPVAVVVYARDGTLTAADRAAVAADRAAFAGLSRPGEVSPARESEDGRALLLSFPIAGDDQDAETVVENIRRELADAPAGLRTAVTGSAGALADTYEALGGVEATLLLGAASVVAVLLLITYRSPFLWLVPLVSVGLASQLAGGVAYLLGRYADLTVTENSFGLMVVLVFGVGTDYALLLIARYREELRRHADRAAAMAVALRRSFPAILASAATVTIGLLCLLAAEMKDLRGLGPIVAAGIVFSLVIMITLLPALLVLLGRWVFWPFIPRYQPTPSGETPRRPGTWHRVSATVGRHPRWIWALAALALVALSFGGFGLRIGQTADEVYTVEVESVAGQRLLESHYPSGASSPARIIAAAGSTDQVVAAAMAVDGVVGARVAGESPDGRWVRVDAVLTDPPDSAAAKDTLDRLRDAAHAVPGADAVVGGQTATILDVERATGRDNRLLMPLILLAVFAVLVLLLRALVAPLLLVASVMLSFAAAIGLAGLLLLALGYPAMLPSTPLYTYLFLVTLGVDYTIFLMTRAREEVARAGNREGVLSALTVTGGVITSAGLVLAATFATLVAVPFVTALQIGLIVAVGVLLDTFMVRTLLIPALAVDVGARIWWPGKLTRVQPVEPPRPDPIPATVGVP